MDIAVIGTGYVGLVVGAGLADFGMRVVCTDSDEGKIERLKKGILSIHEPGLKELVAKNVQSQRLHFSENIEESITRSLVIFVAVGTPGDHNGEADLSQIEDVAKKIARCMDDYKVIVIKSTVPVGTCAWVKRIIEEFKEPSKAFDIVSNPEFLTEGAAVEDFLRPNRVVIGSDSEKAIAIIKDIYRPLYLIETPFVITNLETAEMIKYASNAFLATKISFINEVANLCEEVGADVQQVARGMGLDNRIGAKFLQAGPGFGGSCFPKDTKAFLKTGDKAGAPLQIVEAVIRVNEKQKVRMIEKVEKILNNVEGKTIACLGLSFKPNTNDMREAPSSVLIRGLAEKGAVIKAYDPVAIDEGMRILCDLPITYCGDPYQTACGSDALIVITEWNEFRNIDLSRIKEMMNAAILIDLRNIYPPEKAKELGFKYFCVGRPCFS